MGVIRKSALEIGHFLRRHFWMISGGPFLSRPLCFTAEHKEKHVNKIFTGLSRDFFGGGGGGLVYVFFSPKRNDSKKNTCLPPRPGTIPHICLCLCAFSEGQKRYPKELLRQRFRRTFGWTFWCEFASKPLFYCVVPSNCSETFLVLFVWFFGFGFLFLAPDFLSLISVRRPSRGEWTVFHAKVCGLKSSWPPWKDRENNLWLGYLGGIPAYHWQRDCDQINSKGSPFCTAIAKILRASQMTTKFLRRKFAKFPDFIVMEFPREGSVLGQFSVNFPLPNPLPNANFINIVVFGVSDK